MFKSMSSNLSRAMLVIGVIGLTACASKVRLDDLPAVVDRSTSGVAYTSVDTTGLGIASSTSSGVTTSNTFGQGSTGVNNVGGFNGVNGVNASSTGMSNTGANRNTISTVQAGADANSGSNRAGNNASDMAGLLAKRNIYFDYDSYDIRDEYKAVLQAHARNLGSKRNVKIALEGHTDERGGAEYNLALGQKRANAVQQALQALGVSATQMEAISYGKEKPKSSGATEAGFAENRRVDIRY